MTDAWLPGTPDDYFHWPKWNGGVWEDAIPEGAPLPPRPLDPSAFDRVKARMRAFTAHVEDVPDAA